MIEFEDFDDDRFIRPCQDCAALLDELRNSEMECRKAEDERNREAVTQNQLGLRSRTVAERVFIDKLGELDSRRNYALDALLMHQRLCHPAKMEERSSMNEERQ